MSRFALCMYRRPLEYKYVLLRGEEVNEWQPGDNLVVDVPSEPSVIIIEDRWNPEEGRSVQVESKWDYQLQRHVCNSNSSRGCRCGLLQQLTYELSVGRGSTNVVKSLNRTMQVQQSANLSGGSDESSAEAAAPAGAPTASSSATETTDTAPSSPADAGPGGTSLLQRE